MDIQMDFPIGIILTLKEEFQVYPIFRNRTLYDRYLIQG